MKLGIVTLWTNGRAETPLRARRVPAISTEAPTVETHDVLSAEAKPLFAVDDIGVALEALLAMRAQARQPARPVIGAKAKTAPRKRAARAAAKAPVRSRARQAT